MLLIDRKFIEAAQSSSNVDDLHELLQHAMRLEHSTIPPYLCAGYSLKRNANRDVFAIIKDIAEEEMLHMAMVANIINAIGRTPDIAGEGFVPTYPGPLPMAIGEGLEVGLKKFSRELVHDVFMEIEQPEGPLEFPVLESVETAATFSTIGAFYGAIAERFRTLGDDIVVGDPDRQVVLNEGTQWQRLLPVTDAASAAAALEWIVEDGEGTTKGPLDAEGELAHYYRFAEIYHGRRLIPDDQQELGYAYAGDRIEIDETAIWDIPDNAKAADYPEGSEARGAADYFNQLYTDMLRALQKTFDGGGTSAMNEARGLMAQIRTIAVDIVQITDPETGKNIGLTFEFMPPTVG